MFSLGFSWSIQKKWENAIVSFGVALLVPASAARGHVRQGTDCEHRSRRLRGEWSDRIEDEVVEFGCHLERPTSGLRSRLRVIGSAYGVSVTRTRMKRMGAVPMSTLSRTFSVVALSISTVVVEALHEAGSKLPAVSTL